MSILLHKQTSPYKSSRAGVIALAATLIMVFEPWKYSRWMEYNYIKAHAVEIAEAIKLGKPIKLKTPAYINNTTIEIKITLPNENPLIIKLIYSKIILKTNIQTQAIIKGKNMGKQTTSMRIPSRLKSNKETSSELYNRYKV